MRPLPVPQPRVRPLGCRKHILPYPLLTGVGVLCRQGIGQVDAAIAFSDVALVDVAHVQKMFLQGKNHCGWQHRDTVLLALAIPNQDVLAGE